MSNAYCVYILSNRSRSLYTGMSNNLERRMIEHREERVPGFTSRYRIFRLVHFELFADVRDAIAREKEIKGWRREKKIRLIERDNPAWSDLAEHLPTKHKTPVIPNHANPQSDVTARPSLASVKTNAREGSAFASFTRRPPRK